MFGVKAYHWACALMAFVASDTVVNAQSQYDVITIGSGPGGLVAAEYLSRNPDISVLIIEAGPRSLAATGGTERPGYASDRNLTVFDILGEYENINRSPEYARYRTGWLPNMEPGLGRLVGGCSSINAALYFRVPDAYIANTNWPFSTASVNALMDENEQTHGTTDRPSPDGIWYLQEGYNIVARAFLAQGYSERTLNDAEARNNKHQTFGHPPFASRNGRRDSPANAFWDRMATRANVRLVTDIEVDYILHSGGRATGVMYGGNRATLSSRGTIIMAAGALSTPKVLIRSGIGPVDQLNMLRERCNFPGLAQNDVINNPFVGRNLFDANIVLASFSHPDMRSFRFSERPPWAINQYINENGSGPYSSSGPVLIGYENLNVQGREYQLQATILSHGTFEFAGADNTLTATLFLNNPEARGTSGFDNNCVWQPFREGSLYSGTARDQLAMIQYAQRVVSAMTAQGATFLPSGPDPDSVADWVRLNSGLRAYHYGGSCFASTDSSPESERCADDRLRVVGTSNIFIADASAMAEGTVNPFGFIMYIGREAAGQAASYISSGGVGDGWDVQMPPQALGCSAIEENVDYPGNDIGGASSSNAEGCCGICRNTNACRVYTWTNYNGGTCWMKSARGISVSMMGSRSAQLS